MSALLSGISILTPSRGYLSGGAVHHAFPLSADNFFYESGNWTATELVTKVHQEWMHKIAY